MAIVHSRMAAAWFALGVFVLSGIVSTAAPAECSGARGSRPAHVRGKRPNKATCLSLLSNAVVVWNTVQMTRIIDQLRAKGEVDYG
jgi:TnpA family transposase